MKGEKDEGSREGEDKGSKGTEDEGGLGRGNDRSRRGADTARNKEGLDDRRRGGVGRRGEDV